MGRMVSAPIVNESFGTGSANDDVFFILAGANNKFRIHEFEIHSNRITAEAVRLRLLRRTTTGTGGTAATEVLLDEDDGAITAAMTNNVTAPGTAGAVLREWYWEQLGPLVFMPSPALQPIVDAGGRIALELMTALGATQSWSGTVVWEEL